MTTLITANIQTIDATTDLVVGLGNNPRIILYSNNSGIAITNSSANVILSINSSSNVVLANTVLGVGGGLSSVANVTGTGQLISSGNITPTIITSNTTAYNPTGLANSFIIRLQANSTASGNNTTISEPYISGIVPNINNQIITISNIGAQKIQLRNEDSVNETTAANRFSLPNHIWLYGYQSIQLIYDGVKSRWTPLTFLGASPILSLGYEYDNTNTLRTDYKSLLTKGFFCGGSTTTASPFIAVATADRTTYSSETTAAVTGANLSLARWGNGGAGNVDKGFFVGGFGTAPLNTLSATADRTTFSTELTAAVSGANLPVAKAYIAGAGNADKGFFSGGQTPGVTNTTDRTTYSSETTAAVTGANLTAVRTLTGAAGNADKGFFVGGQSPTYQTTIFRTVYSTELCVTLGIVLATASSQLTGEGNADKGFFIGGRTPTIFLTTANKIPYSSETLITVTGAALSLARAGPAGAGNADKGFITGGQSPTLVTTADRTTYSSETTAAVTGANLSQARYYSSGI
jgi:hypothetical protein